MNRRLAVVAMCVIVGGCSGNSKSGPSTAPTADTSARAVNVTLADLIAQGTSLQATATATLASGSTQAVSTGFKSDVPNVATVTDSGSVTAVSMGRANIYVVFGGQQGTKGIRVIPNYQGNWSGRWIVSGCTQT